MIKRKIIISYYSKENDKLIKSKPIKCTLDQINKLVLKFIRKKNIFKLIKMAINI